MSNSWFSWLTSPCNISQVQRLVDEEISESRKRKETQESKKKLEIPLTTPKTAALSAEPPVDLAPVKPAPFIFMIVGVKPSTKNIDRETKKYNQLLNDGPSSNDKPGVIFICRFVDEDKKFNVFVEDKANLLTDEDGFVILNRIPVRRSSYAAALISSFFNYCQVRRTVPTENGEIKYDNNWYELPSELTENKFRLLIQTICTKINEHPSFTGEEWPKEIEYEKLTAPKKTIAFGSIEEENKKK